MIAPGKGVHLGDRRRTVRLAEIQEVRMSTTVTFAGNLAEDPELLHTRDDKPFVSCRVLVSNRTRNPRASGSTASRPHIT